MWLRTGLKPTNKYVECILMTTNITIPYYTQLRLANYTQIVSTHRFGGVVKLEIRNEAKRP